MAKDCQPFHYKYKSLFSGTLNTAINTHSRLTFGKAASKTASKQKKLFIIKLL